MYIRKKAVEFIEQLRSQPYPESEPMRKFFKTKINDKAIHYSQISIWRKPTVSYLLVLYSKLHQFMRFCKSYLICLEVTFVMRKSFQEDTVDGLVNNQWYYKTITGKCSRIREPPALKGLLKVIQQKLYI